MDLSRYDDLADSAPEALKARYHDLRERLRALGAAPVPDMVAIDALVGELDEVQAALKTAHRRPSDAQRF